MHPDHWRDKHHRLQRALFLGALTGSTGFAGHEFVGMIGGPRIMLVLFSVITVVGWLAFAVTLVRTAHTDKAGALRGLLNDERYILIRAESFKAGFAAVLAVQVLFLAGSNMLNLFTDLRLTVPFAATFTIAVGLCVSLGRFVQLNR
jgi:general stress protein CsbA